jgi:photosystem II stability/assembly factor-like uncharacterized protein
VTRSLPRAAPALATLLLAASIVPLNTPHAAGAAAPAQPTAAADKDQNEQDLIERRKAWFWSSRLQGVSSPDEAARLRWEAAVFTRDAIAKLGPRGAGTKTRSAAPGASALDSWEPKGPASSRFGGWAFGNIAGRVAAFATDAADTVVYVATASGGVWKSTDDGTTWTSVFDSAGTMTAGTVTVDPNDPQTVWVGTGENNQGCESYFGIGLLRSTDGGGTWTLRNGTGANTLQDLSSFADVVVDPRDSNHLVVGGRIRGCTSGSESPGGIFTTTDAGLNWTQTLSGISIFEIEEDPVTRNTWWAGTSSGIYRSTDNGVTWVQQTASALPVSGTGTTELAIAPSDENTVYALFQTGTSGSAEFWATTNGGASWTKKSTGSSACDGQCSYNMVLRVHKTTPTTVYRGTIHVFRSVDSGATWTDLSGPWGSSQKVHQDTHAILMDPLNTSAFWVGSDGGAWKSYDGGTSFVNKNANLNLTQFYGIDASAADPEVMCGGAQDNSSLARSGTSGNIWDLQVATGDGFLCQFDTQNTSIAFATSYPSVFPQVYRSTTGLFGGYGVVTSYGSGISPLDRIEWVTPYVVDPGTPSRLFLGTHRVYRSLNSGSNWTQVGPTDMTGGSGDIRCLEINRGNNAVVYSGTTDSRIWRSTDSGSTWTNISTGLPARGINDIAGDPTDDTRALAAVAGFNSAHLWEWTLSSGSWTAVGNGLPNVPANTVLMLSGTDVLVGTDTGVFRSLDGGHTFAPYMDGLPQGTVVNDLKFHPVSGRVLAGTYGRGAWTITVGTNTNAGTVLDGTTYDKLGNGDIQATWPQACNAGTVSGQAYAIESGDLDLLQSSGTYTHAPVGGVCSQISPAVFTPGSGDEYYLVVPNFGGHEGGAGTDSNGVDRPQVSTQCGPRQMSPCP